MIDLFFYMATREVPLWLFIVLMLVLGAIIGYLVQFLPNGGSGSDDDYFDDFDADIDF